MRVSLQRHQTLKMKWGGNNKNNAKSQCNSQFTHLGREQDGKHHAQNHSEAREHKHTHTHTFMY